jgi:hypothetical protein
MKWIYEARIRIEADSPEQAKEIAEAKGLQVVSEFIVSAVKGTRAELKEAGLIRRRSNSDL